MLKIDLMLKFFFLILLFSTPAYAYIDPGTGSIIIAALVGAFSTGFFYIKNYWTKLKNFFSKKKDTN